jgi:hypothetical protein
MLLLHVAPRPAQVLIDRSGQKSAAAHAKHRKRRVGEILVSGLVDKKHQAMWMHLKHFAAFGLSDVHWVSFCRLPPSPMRLSLATAPGAGKTIAQRGRAMAISHIGQNLDKKLGGCAKSLIYWKRIYGTRTKCFAGHKAAWRKEREKLLELMMQDLSDPQSIALER